MEGIELDLCLHNVNNTQNVICCLHQKKKELKVCLLGMGVGKQTDLTNVFAHAFVLLIN